MIQEWFKNEEIINQNHCQEEKMDKHWGTSIIKTCFKRKRVKVEEETELTQLKIQDEKMPESWGFRACKSIVLLSIGFSILPVAMMQNCQKQ